eukprot:3480907-Rhodomonas_salina.1
MLRQYHLVPPNSTAVPLGTPILYVSVLLVLPYTTSVPPYATSVPPSTPILYVSVLAPRYATSVPPYATSVPPSTPIRYGSLLYPHTLRQYYHRKVA